jgi:hypothetical protein
MTGLSNRAPVDEVVERTYPLLAQSLSVTVSATLDDGLAVEERPNMPATVVVSDTRQRALSYPVPFD